MVRSGNLSHVSAVRAKGINDFDSFLLPPEVVIPTVMGVSGVILLATVGNLLVIVSYIRDARLRTVSNLYVLNLALCDLSMAAFLMPVYLVFTVHDFVWPFGKVFCKVGDQRVRERLYLRKVSGTDDTLQIISARYTLREKKKGQVLVIIPIAASKICSELSVPLTAQVFLVFNWSLFSVSACLVVLISLDHYLMLKKGLNYALEETRTKARIKILLAWVGSFLFYSPAIVGWDIWVGHSNVGEEECQVEFHDNAYYICGIATTEFFLPSVLLAALNVGVYKEIRKRCKVDVNEWRIRKRTAIDVADRRRKSSAPALAQTQRSVRSQQDVSEVISEPSSVQLDTYGSYKSTSEETIFSRRSSNVERGVSQTETTSNVEREEVTQTETTSNVGRGEPVTHTETTSNVERGKVTQTETTSNVERGKVTQTETTSNVERGKVTQTETTSNVGRGEPVTHTETTSNVGRGEPVTHTETTSNVERGKVTQTETTSNVERGELTHTETTSNVERGEVTHTETTSNVERGKVTQTETTSNVEKGEPVTHTETTSNVERGEVTQTETASKHGKDDDDPSRVQAVGYLALGLSSVGVGHLSHGPRSSVGVGHLTHGPRISVGVSHLSHRLRSSVGDARLEKETTKTAECLRRSKQRFTCLPEGTCCKPVHRKHRHQKTKPQNVRKDLKAAKTLFVFVFAFLIIWTPYTVSSLVIAFCEEGCVNDNVYHFFNWLLWLKCAVNPFLYANNIARFNMNFIKIFKIVCFCCKRAWKRRLSRLHPASIL